MTGSRLWSVALVWTIVMTTALIPGLAAQGPTWQLSVGAGQTWFSGGMTDTTSTDVSYTLTPTITWAATADRSVGDFRLGIGLSYLSAHLKLSGPDVELVDRSLEAREWTIAALVTVRVLRVGKGGAGFSLSAGPALGLWTITGLDSRTTIGGIAGLQFAAPISEGWRLLASGGGSVSGSPFESTDLPAEFEPSTLWGGQVGLGLQYAF
ncbi:MAG TPA: hypothetical protein PLI70_08240 [Gemmatimonadales bacterium]|nr:hypothetical protein [Gemmatimonadales bacterium]HRZ09666.1 hypothetical protein [Gemmatimonadales bacterium]